MGLLWIVSLQVEYAPLKAKREECSKHERYILVNGTEKMKKQNKDGCFRFIHRKTLGFSEK